MPVEVEIYQYPYSRVSTTQVLEFKENEKTSNIINAIRDISRICKWYKYRVGISNMWTGWKY